jgi:hypothetical protein
VVAAGILALERHLNTVAVNTGGFIGDIVYAVYYAMPRLDWAFSVRQFLVFDSPMPGIAVTSGALLFYAGYAALLIGASWLLFRRKALNT